MMGCASGQRLRPRRWGSDALDDVRAQKAVAAGVKVHRAHAVQRAGIARADDLVARPEMGFENAGMGIRQTAKGPTSRGPALLKGKPAVHHHVPHFLRFEVEHGELEEVVRQETPTVKPTPDADDARTLAFALLQPSPAGGAVDRKGVSGVSDQAIGGEEHDARERFWGGGPPIKGHATSEAVADEGTVEGKSLRVTEV